MHKDFETYQYATAKSCTDWTSEIVWDEDNVHLKSELEKLLAEYETLANHLAKDPAVRRRVVRLLDIVNRFDEIGLD